MKIRDVEKLTGLTAKSIRYYESRNLITVERNEKNSYRNYTDADVAQLRWIKMFRYLGFSIDEIENLLTKDDVEIKEVLKQKAAEFSKRKDILEEKRNLCLSLAKDYENNNAIVEEYSSAIEFLESDEMIEFREKIENFAAPNLATAIACTLMFMAPVFWLFYNIQAGKTGLLMLNGVFAIIGTALITWNWIHYARGYQENKERVKKKTHKMLWLILSVIAGIILAIIADMVLMFLVGHWILPDDYLFFEQGPVTGKVWVILLLIPVLLFCTLAVFKFAEKTTEDFEDVSDLLFIWNHLKKWRVLIIALWLISFYCCAFNFTAVTEDNIICYKPWYPMGVVYEYTDVDSINAGFGDASLSFVEYKRKGSFYYKIEINGHAIIFNQPTTNDKIERYMEHTYLELEEFDQALVRLGIPKEADKTGWENCDLGKEYVDRFLRIIMLRKKDV